MRKIGLLCLLLVLGGKIWPQQYFPVKQDKKWGLIDAEGQIVLAPRYEAIGEFKAFGYAVMQRDGGVGLLDKSGKEVVPPRYEDLKVLDSTLIAVMDLGEWMVVNLQGKVILPKGYNKVELWDNDFLGFVKDGKWGVIRENGTQVIPPRYDEIMQEPEGFFITRRSDQLGVITDRGREILGNTSQEIRIFNDSLLFFRTGAQWGAIDREGQQVVPPKYDSFRRLTDQYVKLVANNHLYLYSIPCNQILSQGEYDEFYSFSRKYVLVKKDRRLGLMDWCGNLVFSPRYMEIQPYDNQLFRVNQQGRWGVAKGENEVIIPMAYDYIAPLRNKVCLIKKDGLFGVANVKGQEIVPPRYQRVEVEAGQAKAYIGEEGGKESLTLYHFDDDGNLVDESNFSKHFTIRIGGKQDAKSAPEGQQAEGDLLLDNFEWFYSPVADRWGLRRMSDGGIQIEPKFHYIQVEKDLGFTLVGIEQFNKYEFERSTFQFDMIFGLVNNEVGLPVTEIDFWDIRFDDFRKGLPAARCIFSNGRFGLVDRIGRIIKKDMAYIGDFSDGTARVSVRGRMSASLKEKFSLGKLRDNLAEWLSPSNMTDYTQYDQLFREDAALICENCEWGYMDTLGTMVVEPRFSFAFDLVNNVGIVASDGKWGLVNSKGKNLIPCKYDGIEFLENTDNKIVRVYVQEPKYGLIDTLGRIAVNATYDEIGSFAEGRLAVKRNGMWGFVNADGIEVIPCRFREVRDFSQGLAAVKLGYKWGFIDKQGDVAIDFKYRRAGNFKEGLAWVYDEKGAGFINPQDEMVIPSKFEKAFDFAFGVARVVDKSKYGLIDKTGKYVDRPAYSNIDEFNRHGLAVVRYGRDRIRYGVINFRGEKITSDDYLAIDSFSEGMAAVKYKNGYGFIDTTGTLVIPDVYDKVSAFSSGRAAAYLKGQCGYIDRTGSLATPFQFTRCQDYAGERAVVYQGIKNAGLVDLEGNIVMPPEVDRLLKFQEGRGLVRDEKYRFYYITEKSDLYNGYYQGAREFHHGVAVVQINGKWGIINQRGIAIIPPKYDRIEDFQNGYAKVRIEGFNGLSNLEGELIVKPDYEFISYVGQGLFRVEQGDKIGYFDSQGNWVWDLTK
ncbi:MAG TPA: WG repeat-containing protein [Flavilitoribacter sp.]|nr:WG repeat-containing protein [Flavilitoribacter sp.]